MRGISTDMRGDWLVGVLDALRREFGYMLPHEQETPEPSKVEGSRTPLSAKPRKRSMTREEAERIAGDTVAYEREMSGR